VITGSVIGEIHSTINHPFYDGRKLMVVEKTSPQGKPSGYYLIAVDTVGAGPGEPVLVLDEGTGARQVLGSSNGPVRSVIVGIIDHVHIESS
jgi:ethanolamine utilization protein EutN